MIKKVAANNNAMDIIITPIYDNKNLVLIDMIIHPEKSPFVLGMYSHFAIFIPSIHIRIF
jgi:hypothetical protein